MSFQLFSKGSPRSEISVIGARRQPNVGIDPVVLARCNGICAVYDPIGRFRRGASAKVGTTSPFRSSAPSRVLVSHFAMLEAPDMIQAACQKLYRDQQILRLFLEPVVRTAPPPPLG